MKKTIAIVLLLLLNCVSAQATTYYISFSGGSDSNNGTDPTTPWQNLSKVQTTLNACSVAAGTSFLFKRGDVWSWTGAAAAGMLYLNNSCSLNGSAGSPITFGNYGSGALPVFDGNQGNAAYCIEVNGTSNNSTPIASYITVDGIECRNTANSGVWFHQYGAAGAANAGMPGIVVKNVFIHNTGPGAFAGALKGPISSTNKTCQAATGTGVGPCDDGNYYNQLHFLDECADPAQCAADGTQYVNDTVTKCGGHNCYEIQGDFGSPLITNSYCSLFVHECFDLKSVQGATVTNNRCDMGPPVLSGPYAGWVATGNAGSCYYTENDLASPEDITFQYNTATPISPGAYANGLEVSASCVGCGTGTVTARIYHNRFFLGSNTANTGILTGPACTGAPTQQMALDVRWNMLDVPQAVLWWGSANCAVWTISNWDYNIDGALGSTPNTQYSPAGTTVTTYSTLANWQAAGLGAHDSWGTVPLHATSAPTPTPTPTPTSTPTVGAVNDEFVGPFASWINVKTSYGAAGDGVTDDTTAIQSAFTYLQTHGGVLYFPAGTYLISSTLTYNSGTAVRIIGHDPADTMIKWNGASASMVEAMQGFWLSEIGRITFNGNSAATSGVTLDTAGSGISTLWFDDVFENLTSYGVAIPVNGSGNAPATFLRCHFINDGTGLYDNSSNGILWQIWYSTFTNNGVGINSPPGNFVAAYNVFSGSTTADTENRGGIPSLWLGNVSSGSNQFYIGPYTGANGNSQQNEFRLNRILNTTQAAAIVPALGGNQLIVDNQILSKSGNTTAPITSLQSYGPNSAFLIGNQFTVNSPYITQAGSSPKLIEIGDSTVSSNNISTAIPTYSTPPNLSRTITDESVGASAATIQAAINADCPNGYTGGNRPVIHLPAGNYNIATTLSFPPYCDVQLIGDGLHGTNTILTWTGSAGGKVIQLHSPSKVLVQELELNGQGNAEGIYIGSEDVSGSRVQISEIYAEQGVNTAAYTTNLTNTQVNLYDQTLIGSGSAPLLQAVGNGDSSASSRLACWGCDLANGNSVALSLSNQGHLILEGWYNEDDHAAPPLFNLTDSGTLSLGSGIYQPDVTSELPEFVFNGFTGTATLANSYWTPGPSNTTNGYWSISNPTNSNILLFGLQTYDPNWNQISFGTTVALRNSYIYSSGISSLTDQGTMNSAQMINQMAQIRSTSPSQNTNLSAGTSDVQVTRVKLDNLTTGFDVEPETPSPTPTP